jgi:hypothetical protein
MKVTQKHARRLEILRHNYELMKDFALSLGVKQSAFTQTDAELNALQKKINKELSGGVIAPNAKPFGIENVGEGEFIVPKNNKK